MPTKAESLTAQSSDEEYQASVSDCIRQLVEEGRDQAQAAAICYSQGERATGRPYPKQAGAKLRTRARRRGVRITGQGEEEF
jgi:hypothetical protein